MLWSNNASSTIAGSITPTDTTVALAAGTGVEFPNPSGSDYFIATFYDQQTKTINEIVHVTARSTDVLTIVRAQEGTTAKAWTAGDILANLVTAGTLRNFVQASTGPSDTSVVHVGTDSSTDPTLILVNDCNPVPAGFATGMLFNILMNTAAGTPPPGSKVPDGSGHVTMKIANMAGAPSAIVKRTNGSDMIAGNLIASQEYGFIYNGTYFNSYIPPIPQQPPQTTFYVRSTAASSVNMTTGLETGNGLSNDDANAFRTIQGAINTIKSRYMSLNAITLQVADGNYTCGGTDNGNYIAAWLIKGNIANPQNVVIDCTSTNGSTYVPGSTPGVCFAAGPASVLSVQGFTLKSLSANVLADGGGLDPANCHFTAPVSGAGCIECAFGGNMVCWGNCTYTGSGAGSVWACGGGGHMSLGLWDQYGFSNTPLTMTFIGTPSMGYVFTANTNAFLGIEQQVCTFAGGCTVTNGPNNFAGYADTGGGIVLTVGGTIISGLGGINAVSPGWKIP
jgi:hypothetical protein